MLEQHARVIESSQAGVWVEAVEPPGCNTCGGQGCSSRQIAELFQRGPRRYRVESSLGVSEGDRIIVGVPDGSVIRIALYMYGLPLLLILSGALLANVWFPGDAAAVVGAGFGGLVAWGLTALNLARSGAFYRPVVVRREEVILANKGN